MDITASLEVLLEKLLLGLEWLTTKVNTKVEMLLMGGGGLIYPPSQAQLGVPHSRTQVELGSILPDSKFCLLRIQDRAKVFKAQN